MDATPAPSARQPNGRRRARAQNGGQRGVSVTRTRQGTCRKPPRAKLCPSVHEHTPTAVGECSENPPPPPYALPVGGPSVSARSRREHSCLRTEHASAGRSRCLPRSQTLHRLTPGTMVPSCSRNSYVSENTHLPPRYVAYNSLKRVHHCYFKINHQIFLKDL